MISTASLLFGVIALGGNPGYPAPHSGAAPHHASGPMAPPVYAAPCDYGGLYSPGRGYPPYGVQPLPILREWLFREADMPPHNAYILMEPDTYYFRPYNVVQVPQHQKMVTTWGGDIRHPYANELFERVYEAWEAQKAMEEVPVPGEGVPLNEILPLPEAPEDQSPSDAPPTPPSAPSKRGQAAPAPQSQLEFVPPTDN